MVIAIDTFKLAYMAVPKAACTSVKAMLAEIDPNVTLPPPEERNDLTYHALYQTRRFRTDRFKRHKDAFRFTVVRDPIRRLISVYTNRVVGLRDLHNSRKLVRRGTLPLDPDPDTFFQNLATYRRLSSVIRHHALPTWLFTGDDLGVYDRVFRTDQMAELAGILSERAGRAIPVERANSSGIRLDFEELAPKTRDMLVPILRKEYAFLKGHVEDRLS